MRMTSDSLRLAAQIRIYHQPIDVYEWWPVHSAEYL